MNEKCPLCKNSDLNIIYEISNMPIFQNKVYNDEEASKNVEISNLILCSCNQCSFVFNKEFDENIMVYDANYQNEQNYSIFFKNYLNEIVQYFKNNFSKENKIVEIGSGKGYFLNLLEDNGFHNVVGFDPAYEGTKENIIKDYYSEKYKGVYADLIILRHTLEHISEPFEFLKEIAVANSFKGKVFIEVPCFDWIKDKEAFWDIFYEHCNYFTKESLTNMFDDFEVGELFNGQYIYILADLKNLKKVIKTKQIVESNKLFNNSFNNYLKIIKNGKYVVWGAGAKGVTFLNILDKNKDLIKYAVDINPKKQDKYIAKTSHKIIGIQDLKQLVLDKEIDSVFIMNENYKFEIINGLDGYDLNFKVLGDTIK